MPSQKEIYDKQTAIPFLEFVCCLFSFSKEKSEFKKLEFMRSQINVLPRRERQKPKPRKINILFSPIHSTAKYDNHDFVSRKPKPNEWMNIQWAAIVNCFTAIGFLASPRFIFFSFGLCLAFSFVVDSREWSHRSWTENGKTNNNRFFSLAFHIVVVLFFSARNVIFSSSAVFLIS